MKSRNKKSYSIEDRVSACFGTLNLREVKFEDDDFKTQTEFMSQAQLFELSLKNYRFCENYYFICHNDTDTPHIHFVIEFSGSKRLKTILNDFERMGYNRNAVSIDGLGFLNSAIKYMIHYDESSIEDGKTKYELDQIVSNMSYEYLETLIMMDDDELSFSRLVEICTDCNFSLTAIGMKVGLSIYRQYRNVIKDICDNEYRLQLLRDKRESKRLPF